MKSMLAAAVLAITALTGVAGAQAPTRLNANTATMEQLHGVPGISHDTVSAITSKRPFANTAAFDTAAGVGLSADQKSKLYAQVFVPIDLNKASREEIMLIPGMTRRMAHEFEEYRPYTSLAQFDKEIGKYVDAAEVARLRSYVELKL